MNNIERRERGLAYRVDDEVRAQLIKRRAILYRLNHWDMSDLDGIRKIVSELFGRAENAFVSPPFFCDYGFNIEVGKNFFANFNCTILDIARVTIGDNCLFGPSVSIYTAGHPLHPETRRTGYEYGLPVKIGSDVWIGGSAVILPGVTIGDACVIGAGSVVTHDIPPWSLAAGNPCRVIRKITEADRKILRGKEEFDDEAWGIINRDVNKS